MSITEAIITAGGFGTRLQGVIKDVPKPMADIRGRPFLDILVSYLVGQGIKKIVMATCYKAEVISEYFEGHRPAGAEISYSVEQEPLGTGGAVKQGMEQIKGSSALVVNGDTFFDVDIGGLFKKHNEAKADLTMAVRLMPDCARYGTVKIGENDRIVGFGEKEASSKGFINGGVIILNKGILKTLPQKFSFEKDFLAVNCGRLSMFAFPSNGYFIDIGIPEDYERAQKELG